MSSEAGRRRRLPLVIIVIATLVGLLAIFAVWANRQLLNTDNWTDTSTQLLQNDEIKTQLSFFLVDQLYANVDVQGEIEQALPPKAQPLAGPAAGALKQATQKFAKELLGRPRAEAAWKQANRRAHRRFLQVVNGGGDVVSTENGDVTLDLKALLSQTESNAGVGGRLANKLPADAAQLKIMKSDQLEFAQDLVHVLKALAIGLVLLMIGLFALAIYLARGWRREALRACGVGLIAIGAGVLVGRSLAGGAVVDSLAKTDSVRPAVEATWTIGTSLLSEAASATLAYGVVVVLAAWLAGPTKWAVSVRRFLAPYLREPGYAYGGLTLIVLLLLAWGPTPALRKFLPALVLIALLAIGVEALRRLTAREYPDAGLTAGSP